MRDINLGGLRVLNTRPQDQGKELNLSIAKAHGEGLMCPALEIIPLKKWLTALPDLKNVDQAIFISINAVINSFTYFAEQQLLWPAEIKVTVVGKSTANALQQQQVRVNNIPTIADSEHLLLLDCLQHVHHQTILLFKGEGGRTLIAETLKKRGARLIELDVYQRIIPTINQEQLDTWWRNEMVDIILYTSLQAMQNIFTLFGSEAHAWLKRTPGLVISNRLAEAAALLGLQTIVVSSPDTILDTLHQFNKGKIHGKKK